MGASYEVYATASCPVALKDALSLDLQRKGVTCLPKYQLMVLQVLTLMILC